MEGIVPKHYRVFGTHNSFHKRPKFHHIVPFDKFDYEHEKIFDQLSQGIRQFEIDLYLDKNDDSIYNIYGLPIVDTKSNCKTLRHFLKELNAWILLNPNHQGIFVYIQPKGYYLPHETMIGFLEGIEEIIKEYPYLNVLWPIEVHEDPKKWQRCFRSEDKTNLFTNKVTFVLHDYFMARRKHRKNFLDKIMFLSHKPDEVFFSEFVSFINYENPYRRVEEINKYVRDGYMIRARAQRVHKPHANRLKDSLQSLANIITVDDTEIVHVKPQNYPTLFAHHQHLEDLYRINI